MRFDTIRIRAVGKLLAELKQGQYIDLRHSAAVCCTDEPLKDESLLRLPHYCLRFYDTEEPGDRGAFTKKQAAEIQRFLYKLPEDVTTLYCCCDWGQSRSAGLAAACLTAQGQNYEPLFRSSAYHPNLLVYAYMCEALGCGLPSKARLDKLDQMREGEDIRPEPMDLFDINRIVLIGDADFGDRSREIRDLPDCPVVDRRSSARTIPYTSEERIEDMRHIGLLSWEDLGLVMLGPGDLRHGLRVEDVGVRMREYIYWLRYTNQGVKLCLLSPLYCPTEETLDRRTLASLDACFRALASELGIRYCNGG